MNVEKKVCLDWCSYTGKECFMYTVPASLLPRTWKAVQRSRLHCKTRPPSNLRQTTRKCVHLVRGGHFRLRDKDGGHTIQSAIAENPLLHADFTAISSVQPELLPIEKFYIAWIDNFVFVFAAVTLTLTRWPSWRSWSVFPEYTYRPKMNF